MTMHGATLFLLLAGRASLVHAHGFVKTWTVDGVSHLGYTPSNPNAPENAETAERATDNGDNGFADLTSPIVACGGVATEATVPSWPLKAGSTVTAFWDQWPSSHSGPVQEYMAFCGTTCQGVEAASLDWFKIASESWTGTEWASDVISKAAEHDWSFDIPADLAPGAYLVRHEIIAMHSEGSPQVYPVCFQAELTGSGTAKPTDTTTFPAAYGVNEMFKTYKIADASLDHAAFVPPGPALYRSGGASGSESEGNSTPAGNGTAASGEGQESASDTAAVSGQQSSVSTSSVKPSNTASTGNAGGSAEGDNVTTATETAGKSTASSSDKAAGSTKSASSSQDASKPTSTAGVTSTASDQSSSSSGDCMAQMNDCKDKVNKSGAAPDVVSAGLAACDAEHKC